MPITRAGLDLALHDLTGKLRQQSLAEMWGRQPGGPITLSWTVNVQSLHDVDAVMEAGRHRGYRNFNIKVAPDIDFDVELARRVRRQCAGWLPVGRCKRRLRCLPRRCKAAPRLADAGVDVLEAPLRPNQISGYQALKKQAALPIVMDEGVISPIGSRRVPPGGHDGRRGHETGSLRRTSIESTADRIVSRSTI